MNSGHLVYLIFGLVDTVLIGHDVHRLMCSLFFHLLILLVAHLYSGGNDLYT